MDTITSQNRLHMVNKVADTAAKLMNEDKGVIAFVDELGFDGIDFGSFEVSLEVAMDKAGISLMPGATSVVDHALSVVKF